MVTVKKELIRIFDYLTHPIASKSLILKLAEGLKWLVIEDKHDDSFKIIDFEASIGTDLYLRCNLRGSDPSLPSKSRLR